MRSIPVGWVAVAGLLVVIAWMVIFIVDEGEEKQLLRQEIALLKQIEKDVHQPPPQPLPNPHEKAITAIETHADMPLSRVANLIIRDEGKRTRPYNDTTNTPTIGVGRNLRGNGLSVDELHALTNEIDYHYLLSHTQVKNGRVYIPTLALATRIFTKPLTEHDIQLLLTDDLKNVVAEAQQVFGTSWQNISTARKEVVVDVLFNLGLTSFKGFTEFIKAVKNNDWKKAASELLLSDAARKNVARYHRNATVLSTNDERYFGL